MRLLSLLVIAGLGVGGNSLDRETPVVVYDEGTRQGRASRMDCVGAGVSCSVDGGFVRVSVAGGSTGKVGEAYMADASVSAQYLETNPTDCSANQYANAIASNGNLTCEKIAIAGINASGSPSGSNYLRGDGTWSTPTSGAGNFSEVEIDFGTGNDIVTSSASASWVTATSKIVCVPVLFAPSSGRTDGEEDAVIEGLIASPSARVAGVGFSLTVAPRSGRAYGKFLFHCTGG